MRKTELPLRLSILFRTIFTISVISAEWNFLFLFGLSIFDNLIIRIFLIKVTSQALSCQDGFGEVRDDDDILV